MSRNRKRRNHEEGSAVAPQAGPRLPKGGIDRLGIGQAFAEYDAMLRDPQIYVHTPAFDAAIHAESGKYFFVGRRGTGKTALRRYCDQQLEHTRVLVPEVFMPSSSVVSLDLFKNAKKRPFRSLVTAFRRALQDEILAMWQQSHPGYVNTPQIIATELAQYGDMDFDNRVVRFIAQISRHLVSDDEQAWLTENKIAGKIADAMKHLGNGTAGQYTLLIDSIDDYWEGTEQSLVYLTAFMHACLELSTQVEWARVILFLRENIFERVRLQDSESSRLNNAVAGLNWTEEQLLELVEKRLNKPFNTKFPLGGPTWKAFFESPEEAWSEVIEACQKRPRDILVYVSNAIESAQSRKHERILIEDVQGARRRFSDNALKDLGDEYAENYPQIAVVLRRYYGLGRRYTYGGIESMLRRLLEDEEVKHLCGSWIFRHNTPALFIRLLYDIGFVGIKAPNQAVRFRALGPQDTSAPPVTDQTDIEIHPCYWEALDLQDLLVRSISEDQEFGSPGFVADLPEGLDPAGYSSRLEDLKKRLVELPLGMGDAPAFEDIVGDVIKLCFFRVLENVEPQVRDMEGRVIRDWIASNRAQSGFWEAMRVRYRALNVIWECKNYEKLGASDFHQTSYYLNDQSSRLVIVAFRGNDVTNTELQHIRRIAHDRRGFILPLTQKDLLTFIRQAANGKIKEDHIQDRYDAIARKIS